MQYLRIENLRLENQASWFTQTALDRDRDRDRDQDRQNRKQWFPVPVPV